MDIFQHRSNQRSITIQTPHHLSATEEPKSQDIKTMIPEIFQAMMIFFQDLIIIFIFNVTYSN
jgi:surfactin synthase thioesterase subunit